MIPSLTLILPLLVRGAVSQSTTTYLSPYSDPFYNAPSNITLYTPGQVIWSRPVNVQLSGVSAQQILYRTTDSNNIAIATVATIMKGSINSGHQLVAYQDAEDSVNRTCAPSWLFSSGQSGQGSNAVFPGNYQSALGFGWTLVVPDYEGPNSSFAAGRLAGRAVLDALRAALHFPWSGLASTSTLGAVGYSGGAIAAGWAAALHPTYAPELNIAGFSFGGTPVNGSATLLQLDGGPYAALAFASMAGLMQEYSSVNARMTNILTANGARAIQEMKEVCNSNSTLNGQTQFQLLANQSLLSTATQSDGPSLLSDSVIAPVLSTLNLGLNINETPTAPIYMFHGAQDEFIPYYNAVNTAKTWCSRGANIVFASEVGANVGHLLTPIWLSQHSFNWLSVRMNGIAPPSGCFWDTDTLGVYIVNTPAPNPPAVTPPGGV